MVFGRLKRKRKPSFCVLLLFAITYVSFRGTGLRYFIISTLNKAEPCFGDENNCRGWLASNIFKTSNGQEEEVTPCTFAYRRAHIKHMCDTAPPPRINTAFANETKGPYELRVTAIILDERRKFAGCLINKVASTSWYKYLANNSVNAKPEIKQVKRFRLTNWGLAIKQQVPVTTIQEKHNTWTKYMFVRHPMQRLVSAYSHTVKKQKLYNNITFDEFMENLGNGQFVDLNIHWARYSSFCHPCDIDYDFVLKMETLASDLPLLNEQMNIPANATFSTQNKNRFFGAKQNYELSKNIRNEYDRYDSILIDFKQRHPDTFDKVLRLYQTDMDMFGYSWDEKQHSRCEFRSNKACC